jgi:hypothetical protein
MSNLWKPDSQTTASISRGNKKISLHNKIHDGKAFKTNCEHCNTQVITFKDNDKIIDRYTHYVHNCHKMKEMAEAKKMAKQKKKRRRK